MYYGRLKWFPPEELDEAQLRYYNQLVSGPRDKSVLLDPQGRLYGAFNARLLDPHVGTAIQELGAALRFGTALSARAREIAILEVARSERCEFEWTGHRNVAIEIGMTDAEIEGLRTGAEVETFSDAEQGVRLVARALTSTRDLTDEQYKEAVDAIGAVWLFDVISLVGHYQHTALALRVWRVPPRNGSSPAFGSA